MLHGVCCVPGLAIESDRCTEASYIRDITLIASGIAQLNLQERASILHILKQASALHVSPCDTERDHLAQIKVLFKASTVRVHAEVICRVESTDASLSSESDHIGASSISFLQVPELMAPHFSCLSHD